MKDLRSGATLGILEFTSIPRGMRVLNNILKHVNLDAMSDHLISSGRYVGFIIGDYGSIQHGIECAIDDAVSDLHDVAIIGNVQEELLAFANKSLEVVQENVINLFVFESTAHARAIELTNQLLHSTELHLFDIDSKDYLDGKTVVTLYGSIANIKRARDIIGLGEMITNVEPLMRRNLFKRSVRGENN